MFATIWLELVWDCNTRERRITRMSMQMIVDCLLAIVDFLSANWDRIALIGLTFGLCFVTWRLVVQTRRLVDIQVEPRISIYVEWNRSEYDYELIIANNGQGVAKNVRCQFEGDNTYFRETLHLKNATPVDELHFVRHGIEQLEPGQSYRYLIGGTSNKAFESATKKPWIFRLQYENVFGKMCNDTQIVEFTLFRGTFAPPNRLKEISTSLKQIETTLSKDR